MKACFSLLIFSFTIAIYTQQPNHGNIGIIDTDVENFWKAYDKITSTKDTVQQNKYLQELFINKGTPGQKAMIQARGYSNAEYLNAIRNYPKFWASIRKNTDDIEKYRKELQDGIDKLSGVYPNVRPSKIYFTMGALRSGGTTLDGLVLIGSEIALADKKTPSHEFPEHLSHLDSYFGNDPVNNIIFLNIHEYIHTQQKTTIGKTLLAQTLIEGVAEFVATKALDMESPTPQIAYGKRNKEKIKAGFVKEMFSPYLHNWIWNSPNNQYGVRDLAYYVGYAICENYYQLVSNKKEAINKMVELDFDNEDGLIQFVNKSNYFEEPLEHYKETFEKSRPTVLDVAPLVNGQQGVGLDIDRLTIHFSDSMDTRFRNFELGPLGEENLIKFKKFHGFSDDNKALHFEIEPLEPDKTYQIIVGSGFRNSKGIPLKPFLIEFKTEDLD